MTAPYKISCHCGHIQLEVAAELSDVFDCNCSICSRTGFLHWYVPPEAVRLVTEKRRFSTYVWRSVTGGSISARSAAWRSSDVHAISAARLCQRVMN
jgi:hypothetical protein